MLGRSEYQIMNTKLKINTTMDQKGTVNFHLRISLDLDLIEQHRLKKELEGQSLALKNQTGQHVIKSPGVSAKPLLETVREIWTNLGSTNLEFQGKISSQFMVRGQVIKRWLTANISRHLLLTHKNKLYLINILLQKTMNSQIIKYMEEI